MFFNKTQWTASDGEYEYLSEVDGIKITLNKWKKGSSSSYGGRELLARHFLGKVKWQNLARDVYGERALQQMNRELTNNQKKFDRTNTR